MRGEPLRGTSRAAMDGDSPPKLEVNDAAALRVRRAGGCVLADEFRRATPSNWAEPCPGSAVLTRRDRIGAVMFAGTRPSRGCETGGRQSDCVKKSRTPTTDM